MTYKLLINAYLSTMRRTCKEAEKSAAGTPAASTPATAAGATATPAEGAPATAENGPANG